MQAQGKEWEGAHKFGLRRSLCATFKGRNRGHESRIFPKQDRIPLRVPFCSAKYDTIFSRVRLSKEADRTWNAADSPSCAENRFKRNAPHPFIPRARVLMQSSKFRIVPESAARRMGYLKLYRRGKVETVLHNIFEHSFSCLLRESSRA